LAALLLVACGQERIAARAHKCQLVVVLDKTNSVTYKQKLPHIRQELLWNFSNIYDAATKDIQSSRLVITDSTSVFPEPARFRRDQPVGEEDSRGYQQALLQWKTEKRKWLADRVKDVVEKIESPCNHNTTDVLSIFSGIAQVQKNDGPWDSVVVVIFSDMVNTSRPVNMIRDLTLDNAKTKGIKVCSDLLARREISNDNNGNLFFTVYTPDRMENTEKVILFWTGFFEKWGLKTKQYRFE